MKSFSDNELRGIITTDVMARGLIFQMFLYVFNFEIPEVQEQYIHRIGRTGRADKEVLRFLFTLQKRRTFHRTLEMFMNIKVKRLEFRRSKEFRM